MLHGTAQWGRVRMLVCVQQMKRWAVREVMDGLTNRGWGAAATAAAAADKRGGKDARGLRQRGVN